MKTIKPRMTGRLLGLGICAASLSTATGCLEAQEYLAQEPIDEATDLGTTSTTDGQCFTDTYRQPEIPSVPAVDLLFVTDTSGSLDTERGAIADAIDAFVEQMPTTVDLRIAVMLAHGSKSSRHGALYKPSTMAADRVPVLSPQTQSMTDLRSDLRSMLTNPRTDGYSDGGEEGMYSFLKSMSGTKFTNIRAQGFYRETAALAVIFIADENDICAAYPAGITPVPDPEGKEQSAYTRDCNGITPDAVIAAVHSMQGDRPFFMGGIVYNNAQTMPQSGENEYAYGYMDLIEKTQGIAVDLAATNFEAGLGEIGAKLSHRIQLDDTFEITRTGIDDSTLAVTVDDLHVQFAHLTSTSQVQIQELGVPGSLIEVTYCKPPVITPPACTGPLCNPGGGVVGI